MTSKQQEQIRHLRRSGVGYKRIASLLGLSVNTVKSFYHRDKECEVEAAEQEVIAGLLCQNCGKTIHHVKGKRTRLFCSGACRVAYWRSQAAPKGEKKCRWCGSTIRGRDVSRKYCCHACYIAHRFGEGSHDR